MPLQAFLRPWHAGENRIGEAVARELDVENADLRRPLRAACAAERVGEKLVAEAEPEEGPVELAHPAADRALLRDEPGMLLDVPDIHRSAHHPERIIVFERRDRLAGVELDRVPVDAVLARNFRSMPGCSQSMCWKTRRRMANPRGAIPQILRRQAIGGEEGRALQFPVSASRQRLFSCISSIKNPAVRQQGRWRAAWPTCRTASATFS